MKLPLKQKNYLKNFMALGCFLLCFVNHPMLANTNTLIHQKIQQEHAIQQPYATQVQAFKKESEERAFIYQPLVESMKQHAVQVPQTFSTRLKNPPNAMIFVSFSLPQNLFQQILSESALYHLPVVLRGLYQNDFQKTMMHIFNLMKAEPHASLLIDPLWFQTFQINAVPTLVVQVSNRCAAGQVCSKNQFDEVIGNLSITDGLKLMVSKGQAFLAAREILAAQEENKDD